METEGDSLVCPAEKAIDLVHVTMGGHDGAYHGPFCGFGMWEKRESGQNFGVVTVGTSRQAKLDLVESATMAQQSIGDDTLVKEGKQGAVLRLPLTDLRKHAEILAMDTHTWRPPWLGEVKLQIDLGRYVEIERDKRKPPWRMVVVQ